MAVKGKTHLWNKGTNKGEKFKKIGELLNDIIILARTPEIRKGLGRILSCGARKAEQT